MDNMDKQFIIHPGTGTILDRDECVVLDLDALSDEDRELVVTSADLDDVMQIMLAHAVPIMREI
jgi:hypothetical protein